MGLVPHLFKNTSIFIGALCLCFFASSSYATTKILVWGDSLSAAYGIPIEKGWVSLLETRLGDDFEIVNGSISGETTQGGLSRLPAALKTHAPDFVILELGANDGLRGFPPQVTKRNLQQMIEQSKQAQAQVMLLGMKIPPNYGEMYSEKFESQFLELANDNQLSFIPFFLENVIQDLKLLQADELHPTAEAQAIILESILPTLKNALQGNSLGVSQDTPQDSSTETKESQAIKNPA